MAKYIALLRGINMAGHKVIKMEALRACIETLKVKNVRTFIASGNVLFDSPESDEDRLAGLINKALKKSFGHDIAVMLRNRKELNETIDANPFAKLKKTSMPFVTFISGKINGVPKLPLASKKKDLEIISFNGREFFSVGNLVNGRRGYPNTYIEKEFNTLSTTRNWNTVKKLATILD